MTSQESPKNLRSLPKGDLFLLPLGVGNAFTRLHFHTSILLVAGEKVVLVDCPAPLRRICREAEQKSGYAIDADLVDAVFLTHLHGDHCNGMEELGFYRRFVKPGNPPHLHLHESLVHPLWKRLEGVMGFEGDPPGLDRFFQVYPFKDGDRLNLGVEGLLLEPLPTEHFVPCHGFRATFGGVSLGFSSDTRYLPALIEAFQDCDLILHECGQGEGHTDPALLGKLPGDLRRRMRLMHVEDDFDPTTIGIEPLEEGRLYRVGDGGGHFP